MEWLKIRYETPKMKMQRTYSIPEGSMHILTLTMCILFHNVVHYDVSHWFLYGFLMLAYHCLLLEVDGWHASLDDDWFICYLYGAMDVCWHASLFIHIEINCFILCASILAAYLYGANPYAIDVKGGVIEEIALEYVYGCQQCQRGGIFGIMFFMDTPRWCWHWFMMVASSCWHWCQPL